MTVEQPAAPTVPHTAEPRGLRELLRLQQLDLAVDRNRARKAQLEGGEEAAQARARIAALETTAADIRRSIADVDHEQQRLEHDVDSMGLKRRDEEKRLYDGTVANPKELQSIRAEVENIANRTTRMEDRLLELMEEREGLDERLAPVEADATEARGALDRLVEGGAEELGQIEVTLTDLAASREALIPSIDDELLGLYEGLRRTKKGVGVAELRDGVCQGCHQKLSAMEIDGIKRAAGVRRCDHCRRILVLT